MSDTAEKLTALEDALMKLAYAQFNTEVELQKLSKEMRAFKDEMREFRSARRNSKDEKARAGISGMRVVA